MSRAPDTSARLHHQAVLLSSSTNSGRKCRQQKRSGVAPLRTTGFLDQGRALGYGHGTSVASARGWRPSRGQTRKGTGGKPQSSRGGWEGLSPSTKRFTDEDETTRLGTRAEAREALEP